jgi:hypothetical protein
VKRGDHYELADKDLMKTVEEQGGIFEFDPLAADVPNLVKPQAGLTEADRLGPKGKALVSPQANLLGGRPGPRHPTRKPPAGNPGVVVTPAAGVVAEASDKKERYRLENGKIVDAGVEISSTELKRVIKSLSDNQAMRKELEAAKRTLEQHEKKK